MGDKLSVVNCIKFYHAIIVCKNYSSKISIWRVFDTQKNSSDMKSYTRSPQKMEVASITCSVGTLGWELNSARFLLWCVAPHCYGCAPSMPACWRGPEKVKICLKLNIAWFPHRLIEKPGKTFSSQGILKTVKVREFYPKYWRIEGNFSNFFRPDPFYLLNYVTWTDIFQIGDRKKITTARLIVIFWCINKQYLKNLINLGSWSVSATIIVAVIYISQHWISKSFFFFKS